MSVEAVILLVSVSVVSSPHSKGSIDEETDEGFKIIVDEVDTEVITKIPINNQLKYDR